MRPYYALAALLFLAGCGNEPTDNSVGPPVTPIAVETVAVAETDWPFFYYATGTVRAYSYVTVDPNVNACSEPASQNCQPTDVHLYSCGVSCIDMCLQTGTQPTCDG